MIAELKVEQNDVTRFFYKKYEKRTRLQSVFDINEFIVTIPVVVEVVSDWIECTESQYKMMLDEVYT
jgi:hypothetical protein